MVYQNLIHELAATLAPGINPAGVEAWMRLQYGTLDALERATFAEETKLASLAEQTEPGCLRQIAETLGMAADYDRWEVPCPSN